MHAGNRCGFTLIELLTVVVIIAILASAAILKYGLTREKAHVAAMKSDLRNLQLAEEAFFADSLKYSSNVVCSNPVLAGTVALCPTPGNVLVPPTIGTGASGSWTATIQNVNTATTCAIYVGTVTPATPAMTSDPEGTPVCR